MLFSKAKKGLFQNWSLDVHSNITSQITFLDESLVFGTQTGKIICLDFQGLIKWTFDTIKNSESTKESESLFLDEETISSVNCKPLVKGEQIFFGTEKGEFFCINHTGKLIWKQQVDGAIRGTPSIIKLNEEENYFVVFGTIDGSVYMISIDGKKRKVIRVKSPIESNAVFVDEKIVVGCSDGKVIAFNQKGLHLWTYETKGQITADIVVSELFSDGEKILLVGSQDNFLYALTTDGELKWKFETQGSIISSATTAHLSSEQSRDILIGSCDNNMYCISSHGEKLWSYETDFWVTAPPIVVNKDGFFKIFVGSYDQKLYVLDGEGDFNLSFMPGLAGIINQTGYASITTSRDVGEQKGKKLFEQETKGHITSCVQIPNTQSVVVTTKQGTIYEFKLH